MSDWLEGVDAKSIKWFHHWNTKTEQWHCYFKEPRYTKVFMVPNDVLEHSHAAFPLAAIFLYQTRKEGTVLVKLSTLRWGKKHVEDGERLIAFLVNPQTRGIRVTEGQPILEKIKLTLWEEEDAPIKLDVSDLKTGGLATFFKAINSWNGNWTWRKDHAVHLWTERNEVDANG